MTHKYETKEPCLERCGVSAHKGRVSPLNPMTADQYLRKAEIFTKNGDVSYDKLEPFADDAADCMYSGCVVIRNKFIEAAKAHDYREMYRLLTAQYAANDEEVPFFIRAVGGLHVKGVWQMFSEITADKLDYIIQLGIEDELEDEGLLEEDDALGLTK